MSYSYLLVAALLTLTACQKKDDKRETAPKTATAETGDKAKDVAKPEAAKPKVVKPEATKPEATKPEEKKTEEKCDAKPIEKAIVTVEEQSNHKTNGSTAAKPEVAKPKVVKPEVAKHDAKKVSNKGQKTPAPKVDASQTLTASEKVRLAKVLAIYFQSVGYKIVENFSANGQSAVKEAIFSGDRKKAHVQVTFEDGKQIEFKDFELKTSTYTNTKHPEGLFTLSTVCVDAKCELNFSSLNIFVQGNIAYNNPLVFKKIGDKYVRILDFILEPEEAKLAFEASVGQEPPALVLEKQLAKQLEENEVSLNHIIRQKMRADDSIYTFRMAWFTKAIPETDMKKEGNNLTVTLNANFNKRAEIKDIAIKTVLTKNKEELKVDDNSSVVIERFNDDKLILITLDQKNIKSVIPGATRGTFSLACSVLIADGETLHECVRIAPSGVFGILAREGKVNGPYYTRDALICDEKGTNVGQKPVLIKEFFYTENNDIIEVPLEKLNECKEEVKVDQKVLKK